MPSSRPEKKITGVSIVLAIMQIIGWGTVGLPAIIGHQVAADLHMNLPAVFAGSSALHVVMGLWAPVLAKGFTRFVARSVKWLDPFLPRRASSCCPFHAGRCSISPLG